jgi:hypothetical protein
MRRTPNWRWRRSFEIASLPQQEKERWIGQSWFRRSRTGILLGGRNVIVAKAGIGIVRKGTAPRGTIPRPGAAAMAASGMP